MNARLAACVGGVAAVMTCAIASMAGDIMVRNSATNDAPDMEARLAEWLADCGVETPTYLVDFEAGFTDMQNVSGVAGLFPGGLIITDTSTANLAEIRTGSSFGGSRPYGVYALKHNEKPYLELEFPGGVDGFSLSDIDHTGTTVIVQHSDGKTSTFTLDGTEGSYWSGEFIGVWRNDRPPIVRVRMDASGDGTWGIDNVQWVGLCLADFNADGFVNGLDYDGFAELFEMGDIAADINGDTFVNGLDYDVFAGAFEAGC